MRSRAYRAGRLAAHVLALGALAAVVAANVALYLAVVCSAYFAFYFLIGAFA